jgi:hypothetical protein
MSHVRSTHIDARSRLSLISGLICLGVLLVAGCTQQGAPTTPASLTPTVQPLHLAHDGAIGSLGSHGPVADDKGYIDGWFNGETVQLHYTKAFFCDQPPSSGATTECEIGADPEVAPRPGPIPTIYAIAAVGGIQPERSTLACPPGSTCLNHPAMIDVSRLRGPGFENSPALPHSHILAAHHAGWFNTVNIRVSDLGVWNQVAAAKRLEKVRELQADPAIGGKGLISRDTPTNIYFFIASWH